MTVKIEIDGIEIAAEDGAMLIQAADQAGISIPRFCYHDELSLAASCRMCLVEVEGAPKPLPACATPVSDGMKVQTRSNVARTAQKGTMEFLLINHPLDCPVCDQGGECDLQDIAVGYGKDVSRYTEAKRIVDDKDIGPLIATDLTRCIHCTRCVRFGQEIAGIMEFGAANRGEHMRIGTFLDRSVDSELSGNVIDLCPVGSLTSKPFRFRARAWELQNHAAIAPHDALGSNIHIQARGHELMRVLPRDNAALNKCWLSDRDRFSYEALLSESRLDVPMVRKDGVLKPVSWDEALQVTADGLRQCMTRHGANSLGALVSPTATFEEAYLMQALVRGLGSGNIDHRLRQLDFSDDAVAPPYPWFGQPVADLENMDAVLLVGSNLRKDIPLFALRVRKAATRGAAVMAVNALDYDFTYKLAHKIITAPDHYANELAAIAKALHERTGGDMPAAARAWLSAAEVNDAHKAIAEELHHGAAATVLVGASANHSINGGAVRALAELICTLSGAALGHLPEANGAGAWLAGAVPHRGPAGEVASVVGHHARHMISDPLKAYITLGIEPELDCADSGRARTAMHAAEFVVMMTSFMPEAGAAQVADYADVLLPMAAFAETQGSFINGEGLRQHFDAAVPPPGQARPAWKILRRLGELLAIDGFDFVGLDQLNERCDLSTVTASAHLAEWQIVEKAQARPAELLRILEVPPYAGDIIVRRAPALQATADNPPPSVRMNARQAESLGLAEGDAVIARMVEGAASLSLVIDARVPAGAVVLPAGYAETADLGAQGLVTVEKE